MPATTPLSQYEPYLHTQILLNSYIASVSQLVFKIGPTAVWAGLVYSADLICDKLVPTADAHAGVSCMM